MNIARLTAYSCLLVLGSILRPQSIFAEEPNGSAEKKHIVVAGRVIDEQQQPVAQATVEIMRAAAVLRTETDENGRFRIEVPLPAVGLLLQAYTADRLQQGTCNLFEGHSDYAAKDAAVDLEVTLKAARAISIIAVDSDDRPVADAWAVIMADYSPVAESMTNGEGTATLLIPADVSLQYVAAGKKDVGLDYFAFALPDQPRSNPHALPQNVSDPVRLELNGTRPVTVRVVDSMQQPLSGLPTYLWYVEKPERGGSFNTSGFHRFHTVTGEDGRATFDFVPADNTTKLTFWLQSEEYWAPERPMFDPAAPVAEVVAEMVERIPIEGTVKLPDGAPAAGAEIRIAGSGYYFDDYHAAVAADEQGHFVARVYPNQYYAVHALLDTYVSPVAAAIIRDQPPQEPIELKLESATRLFGQLTLGAEQQPAADAHIALYQQDVAPNYHELPEAGQLPNPKQSRKHIAPLLTRTFRTDANGNYEIYVGPGTYYMFAYVAGFDSIHVPQFRVSNEPDMQMNLHGKSANTLTLDGQVVFAEEPTRGAARVRINGIPVDDNERYIDVETDDEGRFECTRSHGPILIYARTEDRQTAGIMRLQAGEANIRFEIGPTAKAKGRLVDPQGMPLSGKQIDYGVRITRSNGSFTNAFGASAMTNDAGEFELECLVPDWPYHLEAVLERDGDGNPRRWQTVDLIQAQGAIEFDLGDVVLGN